MNVFLEPVPDAVSTGTMSMRSRRKHHGTNVVTYLGLKFN